MELQPSVIVIHTQCSDSLIHVFPYSLYTVAQSVQLREWNWLCPLCVQSCWWFVFS